MHLSEEIREVINSKRIESRIKTQKDLDAVLRKRRFMSGSNNHNFENVYAKILEERQIRPRTTTIYSSAPTSSYYESARSFIEESRIRNRSPDSSVSSGNGFMKNYHIAPEVTDMICVEIGSKWKDLSRALQVKEFEIDNINVEHREVKEKMRKSLETFERRVPRSEWFTLLCNGLHKARRNDLKNKIEKLGYDTGSRKSIFVPTN